MDVAQPSVPQLRSEPPSLTVECAGAAYTVQPDAGAVSIGREFPAQIRIDDQRVSRAHLRLQPAGEQWVLTDLDSTNGTYVDGVRSESVAIGDGMVVNIGDAHGIPVRFSFAAETAAPQTEAQLADSEQEDDRTGEQLDPAVVRAGAAVAARREQLGLSQRKLSEDKVISQSVLVSFERGRSWPRERTRAKIEEYLSWEPGTIARIRAGVPVVDAEGSTEVLSPTAQVAMMRDAAEIALVGVKARIDTVPAPTDASYPEQVHEILRDLRKLEASAANAARHARGPETMLILSDVRRTYNDLMLRAARAPQATLGQRLYAVRHRAELSVDETARAAGVSVDAVAAAEEGRALAADAIAALETLIRQLRHR